MHNTDKILRDEQGSIVVVAILMLALITLIVFTASRTSNVEVQISTNQLIHEKYFFAAEAGIDHAVKLLEQPFVAANAPLVKSGSTASWTFAFTGRDRIPGTSDDASDSVVADTLGSYEEGAIWIENATLDGITYRITLWNNNDSLLGGTYNNDQDGLVWVRSDASGPRGGSASVQVLLQGDTTGESVSGYNAQAGAGAGKNFNSNELDAISDFIRQM